MRVEQPDNKKHYHPLHGEGEHLEEVEMTPQIAHSPRHPEQLEEADHPQNSQNLGQVGKVRLSVIESGVGERAD